jgi:solute carrier family 25 phosphate transporter 3
MLGSVLVCGLTHAGITPLDAAKCNMQVYTIVFHGDLPSSHRSQVNPTKYKGSISTLKTIVAEKGTKGVWKGVRPTLIGYSLRGMFKYGLYEIFKDYYMNLAGEEASENYKGAIWLAGSASTEFFADIALCLLEMTTKPCMRTQPCNALSTLCTHNDPTTMCTHTQTERTNDNAHMHTHSDNVRACTQ